MRMHVLATLAVLTLVFSACGRDPEPLPGPASGNATNEASSSLSDNSYVANTYRPERTAANAGGGQGTTERDDGRAPEWFYVNLAELSASVVSPGDMEPLSGWMGVADTVWGQLGDIGRAAAKEARFQTTEETDFASLAWERMSETIRVIVARSVVLKENSMLDDDKWVAQEVSLVKFALAKEQAHKDSVAYILDAGRK